MSTEHGKQKITVAIGSALAVSDSNKNFFIEPKVQRYENVFSVLLYLGSLGLPLFCSMANLGQKFQFHNFTYHVFMHNVNLFCCHI